MNLTLNYFFKACFVEKNLHRISIIRMHKAESDLIREFSLQVNHQRFFVSANGFFRIDLKLLRSVRSYCICLKGCFARRMTAIIRLAQRALTHSSFISIEIPFLILDDFYFHNIRCNINSV